MKWFCPPVNSWIVGWTLGRQVFLVCHLRTAGHSASCVVCYSSPFGCIVWKGHLGKNCRFHAESSVYVTFHSKNWNKLSKNRILQGPLYFKCYNYRYSTKTPLCPLLGRAWSLDSLSRWSRLALFDTRGRFEVCRSPPASSWGILWR